MNWKDTTSWARTDVDRTPRTWSAKLGDATVIVTRHLDYPGSWLLRTRGILSIMKELESKDVEAAKKEALYEVKLALTVILTELDYL